MKAFYKLFATQVHEGNIKFEDLLFIFKAGTKKELIERGHWNEAEDKPIVATLSNAIEGGK